MNEDLARLMNLLACVSYDGSKHSGFIVKEPDQSARLRQLIVEGANGDWFVFYPEKGLGKRKVMSPLLTTGANCVHHKACDAVLISLSLRSLRVVYIELKSNNPTGCATQLTSTSCFVQYVLAIGQRLYSIQFDEVDERFITFYAPLSLRKRPTRPVGWSTPSKDIKNPAKVAVANGERIYLKQLLCG